MNSRAGSQSSRSNTRGSRRSEQQRSRDYLRIFKACDTCRSKKTRCIVSTPHVPGSSCQKCQREWKECSFTKSRASRQNAEDEVRPLSSDLTETAPGVARPSTSRRRQRQTRDPETPALVPDFNSIATVSASGGSDGPQDSVLRTTIANHGDTMRLLAQSSRNQQRNGPSPQEQQTPLLHSQGPIVSELSNSDPDTVRLWNSFRFVRMGWLTAREAISYVDLFFENLSVLSPILDDFYSDHKNHYALLTQEPLLCCTILMISSRYHSLRGACSLSRSITLHDRFWDHCQHLISRITFGQEKISKAKTRTFGSIQALMLITEWPPRALYFPPKTDGFDGDVIFLLPDNRDEPGSNQADVRADSEGSWMEDVALPAKLTDRMSWMLLGCAISLGHELGVFNASRATSASTTRESLENLQRRRTNYLRMRKIFFIADEQFSSRLGCTSLISGTLGQSAFEPLPSPAHGVTDPKRVLITAELELASLARSISDTLFASTVVTRELIQSYRYMTTISHFQQQLVRWREQHLDSHALSGNLYEALAIEYHYNCIFLNSLGMQAVVDRSFESITRAPTPDRSESAFGQCPPRIQSFITPTDSEFIQEVINGSCQILQSAVRLADSGSLRCCPIRITMRVIAASVFLLKALSIGVATFRLETSLELLQSGIDALRRSTWDDVDLAARYAAMLDLHLVQYRRRFVGSATPRPSFQGQANLGQPLSRPSADGTGGATTVNVPDPFASEDWLSVPFDISLAPFGVAAGDSAELMGLDDGDWSFLWNLPLVQ